MTGPFEPGERALLVDRKGRRYLVTLRGGTEFHFHHGVLAHDAVIGSPEGSSHQSSGGGWLVAYRPGLADFVLKMPRGAQVIYPKDIGVIIIEADIYPGAAVIEAGTGSGALTLALARAVGDAGRVLSYDLREDHSAKARANLEGFLGKIPDGVELRIGDVCDHQGEPADRLILDLPDPERVIARAGALLRSGGILCAYVPTVGQVSATVEALREASFGEVRAFEVLVRPWHVEGQSVRPEHRMVAHTGFIMTGRAPG